MINPQHILDSLNNCINLLNNAADADEEGNFEEMMANLAAMAPQLHRARNNLKVFLEDRESKEALDVIEMDQCLAEIDMTWGYTKTAGNSPFIADDICIARRAVCDPEFLDQLEASEKGREAPDRSIRAAWDKLITEPRSVLSWEGVEGEEALFSNRNGDTITVDAGRLACLRALSLFDRAELSLEPPQAVVFFQTGDPTPVSVLLSIDG